MKKEKRITLFEIKKIIFFIILIGILMNMSASYAFVYYGPPVEEIFANWINDFMTLVIIVSSLYFLIKFTKVKDKKSWTFRFLIILSITLFLKLSSLFLAKNVIVPIIF